MVADLTQADVEAWDVMWMAADVFPARTIYGTIVNDRVEVMAVMPNAAGETDHSVDFAISRAFLWREKERAEVIEHVRRQLQAEKGKLT